MLQETVSADLTVVGGGLAGTSAAIQAARFGLDVALVNDRPVLGGNSSSEIRVWPSGATGGINSRYAREGGIMEEWTLANKSRNADGNADLWDMILEDAVRAEENLSVYVNTLIDEVETKSADEDGDARVVAVSGSQNMTEKRFRFESDRFVDATGDGVLAVEAGATWRQGREGTDEYGELAAPDEADDRTLGSTIMFYTERTDEPVEFEPPEFAHDFKDDPPSVLAKRAAPNRNRCLWWWVEYGGEADLDPIRDNDEIRDELWAIVFGAWDYLKNSGEFDDEGVENLTLSWIGKRPGKRESRRIMGDYVLDEDDITSQRRFDDAIGHGGWSIDLHPPSGFYDELGRGTEHWHLDGPYSMPYRILYPHEVENLFLTGRHVSATHVAFGSLRVQMTLSTLGQAVGAAAAISDRHDVTPADVGEKYVETLQQSLLREDQWIIGQQNEDPADHARDADVSASSSRSYSLREADTVEQLDEAMGLHLAAPDHVDTVSFRLGYDPDGEAAAETAHSERTEIDVEIWTESLPENYIPDEHVETVSVTVPAGGSTWVDVPVDVDPGDGQGLFLVFEAAPDVNVYGKTGEYTGVVASARRESETGLTSGHLVEEAANEYYWPSYDWVPCFDIAPEPDTMYAPERVTDGYARPFGRPHSWVSEPFEAVETDDGADVMEDVWVSLSWDAPRTIAAVQLAFNSDLSPWYSALLPTDEPEVAEVVRDYRVEARVDGAWQTLATVSGNYQRFRRHTFDAVETDEIRVLVDATNGRRQAEIFEIRAYGPDQWPPLIER